MFTKLKHIGAGSEYELYDHTYSILKSFAESSVQPFITFTCNVIIICIATDFNQTGSQIMKFLLPPTLCPLHNKIMTIIHPYIPVNTLVSINTSKVSLSKFERLQFFFSFDKCQSESSTKGFFLTDY